MIALEAIRDVIIWFGIHPDPNSTTPIWKKYSRIGIAFGLPINLVLLVLSAGQFFYVNININMEVALFALFAVIFGSCQTYGSIIAYSLRHDVTMTIAEFQHIYDECKF